MNECVKTPHFCHKNASCTNIKGNYACDCVNGFTGDGYREFLKLKLYFLLTSTLLICGRLGSVFFSNGAIYHESENTATINNVLSSTDLSILLMRNYRNEI